MRDVEKAIDRYRTDASERVALAFVDDLETTYELLAAHPGAGSLRFSYDLGLPGLRYLPLRRHPYLVFYRDLADRVDVWRVLHAKRDVPAWIVEPSM